ncbi:MAG: hypothetical protein OEY64_00945 [Nitrospinota bacterium]|nr:hypothetical protein [Nitrospinota bacterium]
MKKSSDLKGISGFQKGMKIVSHSIVTTSGLVFAVLGGLFTCLGLLGLIMGRGDEQLPSIIIAELGVIIVGISIGITKMK